MILGVVLGLLIGVITGTVFVLIFNSAVRASERGNSSILTLTAELLVLPTFWFGGPWLTGKLLEGALSQDFLDPYVISLAITFLPMASIPAGIWIIRLSKIIGAGGE